MTTRLPLAAGVIGHRIAKSRSPIIHGFWLDQLGLAGSFNRFNIAPDDLDPFMRSLPTSGLRGVNVTIPHKQAVMPYCQTLTPLARQIGAVNTIVVQPGGSLLGHNTDIGGFTRPLADRDWTGRTAVVIGNGGAARAVLCGLIELGFGAVRAMARRVSATSELFLELGLDPGQCHGLWQGAEALAGADLLVNASSLGMEGHPALEIDLAPLKPDATVFDIVYVPLETPLLAAARATGLRTIDGLEMLIGQAAEAFGLFFDHQPNRAADQEALLRQKLRA